MKLGKQYKYFLFDLDGTLTNPVKGITNSIQYALEKIGLNNIDKSVLEKFIGPPLRDSFKKYFNLDDTEAEQAVSYYREYYSPNGIYENDIYDGIYTMLDCLTNNLNQLFVVTSKPKIFAERILEHFKMTKYFVAIIGSELNGLMSDKGELIEYCLKNNIKDEEPAIMVGDRDYDIIGANKNKIDSIGVGYGYGTTDELINAGATYYYESVKDLCDAI
jgi:phosphoglycolate phosphatase